MGSGTGSSSSPSRERELAASLHRLRSTLARVRAEIELVELDGETLSSERLLSDMREALERLSAVESAALGVVRVLVVDDDERLGALTARGLRRLGFDAESASAMRSLRPHEVVVFDLGLIGSLSAEDRQVLRESRPVVLTGAVDSGSRALAEDLGASEYVVKPAEPEVLAAAIMRRDAED